MEFPQRLGLGIAGLLVSASLAAGELVGRAIVRDDGSLLVGRRVVHLYGIYMPETNRQCRSWISPVRCAPQAVLQLDFIAKGILRCQPQRERSDGSLEAVCFVDRTRFDSGTDIGAHLIESGWALARPEAPFEYQAAERIAHAQGLGVWAFTVDSIQRGRQR